jgi:hypothetical protein
MALVQQTQMSGNFHFLQNSASGQAMHEEKSFWSGLASYACSLVYAVYQFHNTGIRIVIP